MYKDDRVLDSYQNEVISPPGNESVEAPGTEVDEVNIQRETDPFAEAAVSYANDGIWGTDEEAERIVEAAGQTLGRARDQRGRWTKV
ncbi:MAG TPA: hypothetical protein VGN70_11655 [Gammaproteobacteria bacterium]|jgi:hypothetical protein